MGDYLSISDIALIKELLPVKTDEEIAGILGKSPKTITRFYNSLKVKPNRPGIKKQTKRKPASKKPLSLEQKERMKVEEKEQARKKLVAEGEKRRITRQAVIKSRRYKTREVDNTGLISYRLNHKTVVWAKPGEDIDLLRKRYNIKIE
jgi:hypothetical protein